MVSPPSLKWKYKLPQGKDYAVVGKYFVVAGEFDVAGSPFPRGAADQRAEGLKVDSHVVTDFNPEGGKIKLQVQLEEAFLGSKAKYALDPQAIYEAAITVSDEKNGRLKAVGLQILSPLKLEGPDLDGGLFEFLEIEPAIEMSMAFATLGVKFKWQDQASGVFASGSGTIRVGLSVEGWKVLADKLGVRRAYRVVLSLGQQGARILGLLRASAILPWAGYLAIGVVGTTFEMLALVWAKEKTRVHMERRLAAGVFADGYVNTVFAQNRPAAVKVSGDQNVWKRIEDLGGESALLEAKENARRLGDTHWEDASDGELLDLFKLFLQERYGDQAWQHTREEVELRTLDYL